MTPCENHVKSCSSVEHGGQCVTRGLCCNSKGIRYSKVCINNFVLVPKSIIYILQAYVLKMLNAKRAKSLEKAILQPQAMIIRTQKRFCLTSKKRSKISKTNLQTITILNMLTKVTQQKTVILFIRRSLKMLCLRFELRRKNYKKINFIFICSLSRLQPSLICVTYNLQPLPSNICMLSCMHCRLILFYNTYENLQSSRKNSY